MESEVMAKAGQAFIGIDKVAGTIQFTVPRGTSLVDVIKALGKIDPAKIPGREGGCPACMCGYEFKIRENFDKVINVQLGRPG